MTQRLLLLPSIGLLGLCGCWKTDRASLPVEVVDFSPRIGAPSGWVVEERETPIECPDGTNSSIFVAYPEGRTEAMAATLVLHSGAFDYARDPTETDPTSGPHFQEEDRLSRDWAVRRVFFTLGMFVDEDRFEDSDGALAAALAEQDVALVLPANCWGDWWHNTSGVTDNDFASDHFYRNGRFAAEWTWRVLTEPSFAEENEIELPVGVLPEALYVVGLGEGGRGVGELLASGYEPTAILVDSSADDLRPYYEASDLYGAIVTGLERIFPDGSEDTIAGSLASVTLPDRVAYVYSGLDTQIPADSHEAALGALAGVPEVLVIEVDTPRHVLSGTDLDLAREAAQFLVDGPADSGS